MTWSWIPANSGEILSLTAKNALLGVVPALIGLAISLPLGIACVRWGWLYPPALSGVNILYALPSLAVFVALQPYFEVETDPPVIIALTVFSLCVLLPSVVDGLRAVPEHVRQSATAMGFGPLRRLTQVEMPLAAPVIIGGLRVATVSSISLASVGQLIGVSSLGYLFIDGYQRAFPTEIYVGITLLIILAAAADLLLVLSRWWLTAWRRGDAGEAGVT